MDAEREIRQKLWKFPIPKSEMELYRMDQEINDRGILVDQQLVENAVLCDNQYRQMVMTRAYELTGLSNPNSPAQIQVGFPSMAWKRRSWIKRRSKG